MFNKNNIELRPQEIWIRIRFLDINGSPSLVKNISFIEIGEKIITSTQSK